MAGPSFEKRGRIGFWADWSEVVMIHFAVEAERLQPAVPYPLDLYRGQAYVSLIAFTIRRMRPTMGGKVAALAFSPLSTHPFLNVRTYVKVNGVPGIHFMAEWLPNRLSVFWGPRTFALPYRYGRLSYDNNTVRGSHCGTVRDVKSGDCLSYSAEAAQAPTQWPAPLEIFLTERYVAFNQVGSRRRQFRVDHPPWELHPLTAQLNMDSLLTRRWPFLNRSHLTRSSFSDGFRDVFMGPPERVE